MTAGPDRRFAREASTTHFILFPAGITVVGYRHAIGRPRCRFAALSLAVGSADGSPVRAVASVE